MSLPEAALHRLGGDGPGLLLIHGFGADRLAWAANAHALTARATVWAVDLPGHGAAANDVGDGTASALAAAVAQATEGLDGPLVVAGHSLGGAVALHLAADRPERVSALALIAPAGLGRGIEAAFLEAFPELSDADSALTALRRLVVRERLIQPPMARHVVAGLTSDERRKALRRIAAALGSNPTPPWPPRCPVRLIWGTEDRVNPLPAGAADRFGDMLVTLPDTGHLPQVEAPGKVAEHVLSLLPD